MKINWLFDCNVNNQNNIYILIIMKYMHYYIIFVPEISLPGSLNSALSDPLNSSAQSNTTGKPFYAMTKKLNSLLCICRYYDKIFEPFCHDRAAYVAIFS